MPDTLSRLLSMYPARARPLAPPTPLGNAGGGSGARLWRFDSGLGPLVARAYPPDGPDPSSLSRIHGWIARLADLDFIPVPLATLDGRTLVVLDGLSWEVTPWKSGVADPSPARLRAALGGLAAVHQRLAFEASIAPSPGLMARLGEAESLMKSELARFETLVRNRPNDPGSTASLRWIALAREGLPGLIGRLRREAPIAIPIQPVLRDARPEHFLFDGDRLTGLVDLAAMGLDSPSTDLARLLTEWVGPDRSALAEALDAYAAIHPLDPAETARIDLFAESSAWLGPARWIRWHYADGRRFDDPDAVRLGLDRTLSRLVERLMS
jgi:hypothetical protein